MIKRFLRRLGFLASVTFLASTTLLALPSQDSARQQILHYLAGDWIARSLYVAAKLDIADHLQEGPLTVEELADRSQTKPESLQRLMHTLSSFGFFEELEDGTFANSESSSLLITDHPETLHQLAVFYGEEIHRAWNELETSIRSGQPGFNAAYQQAVFEYFKKNPLRAALFQGAMKEKSSAVIQSALGHYPFEQFQSVCDVGGGYGHFIQAILEKHPAVQGTLFDLPEVIAAVPQKNPKLNAERCQLISGNFFVSIPKGADAYLLKSVIHDWNDEQSEQILRHCADAMQPHSKLLIVEAVLLPKEQSKYANCMDLLMLTVTGGKERSLSDFKQLLEHSGLVLNQIYSTSTEFSILEVVKK